MIRAAVQSQARCEVIAFENVAGVVGVRSQAHRSKRSDYDRAGAEIGGSRKVQAGRVAGDYQVAAEGHRASIAGDEITLALVVRSVVFDADDGAIAGDRD